MKKALLINGYETFEGVGQNRLNKSLIQYAKEILEEKKYCVSVTEVQEPYDAQEEHDKILEADFIFVQTPIYWFGVPGAFKSYIDKVFIIGYANGTMSKGDGRTRTDPNKKYGTGGLLTNKKYMISTTWNAPFDLFDNKEGFLEGLSLEEATFTLHKTFQFCGLEKMPSFSIHDIFKEPNRDEDVELFKKHINENF